MAKMADDVKSWKSSAESIAIKLACDNDLEGISQLSDEELRAGDKQGSCSLHWAAGSGSLTVLKYLIESRGLSPSLCEQSKGKGINGRTACHFAARNGHIEVVRYLCEITGVDSDHCAKSNVTPFQLSVWQNHLEVARYLVEEKGVNAHQLNDFACGAQHWIGLAPKERAGENGKDLIPMAEWLLHDCKLDFRLPQRQAHTPLHKASWGGHLALVQWLCTELDLIDDLPDQAGNYASDIASMGYHTQVADWLRRYACPSRVKATKLLGVDRDIAHDDPNLKVAYHSLCKLLHPDRQGMKTTSSSTSSLTSFDEVTSAYSLLKDPVIAMEHVQRNKRHSLPQLIELQAKFKKSRDATEDRNGSVSGSSGGSGSGGKRGEMQAEEIENVPHSESLLFEKESSSSSSSQACLKEDKEDMAFFFKTKLVASILEYGMDGLPLAMLPKKYEQVWNQPLPSSEALGLRRHLSLQKILKHYPETVRIERDKSDRGCIRVHVVDKALAKALI